jgi:O-antigen/teichoic acid export membrane protein
MGRVTTAADNTDDLAQLAKGGRTNTMGFVVRLIARIPFLIIATRLYGAESLGRFASALVLIEIVALICSLGEKRGLAQRLSVGAGEDRTVTRRVEDDFGGKGDG